MPQMRRVVLLTKHFFINSSENKALTEQYTEFLARKPVVPEHQKAVSEPEQKSRVCA